MGPGTPLSVEDARHLVARYVEHHNTICLHSAIGYLTPSDMLEGHQQKIFAARDHKLETARALRQLRRQQAATQAGTATAIGVH